MLTNLRIEGSKTKFKKAWYMEWRSTVTTVEDKTERHIFRHHDNSQIFKKVSKIDQS